MKKKAKQITYIFLILFLLITPLHIFELKEHDLEAASSGVKTLDQILEKRSNYLERGFITSGERLVNILIVPGHDDENSGTQYRGLREVELNRELSKYLYEYLSEEPGINVVLASDEQGYSSIFKKYFKVEERKIKDFIKKSKKSFTKKNKREKIEEADSTIHNAAPSEVVLKLYGINKWVNSQKFDLVIHVHFNDYPGRKSGEVGKENGFSIYTPGKFLDNNELSNQLAESVFDELKKVRPVSSLEMEKKGIIENHALIALGANQTLDAGSILVEYGYIYEDSVFDPIKRPVSLDAFAYSTYVGIKKLLNETPKEKTKSKFKITKNNTTLDNLKWQYQKAVESKYPPAGFDLRECPITGYFGNCSEKASEL